MGNIRRKDECKLNELIKAKFPIDDIFYIQWTLRLYDVDGNGVVDPSETLQVQTDILAVIQPGCHSEATRGCPRTISNIFDMDSYGLSL